MKALLRARPNLAYRSQKNFAKGLGGHDLRESTEAEVAHTMGYIPVRIFWRSQPLHALWGEKGRFRLTPGNR